MFSGISSLANHIQLKLDVINYIFIHIRVIYVTKLNDKKLYLIYINSTDIKII